MGRNPLKNWPKLAILTSLCTPSLSSLWKRKSLHRFLVPAFEVIERLTMSKHSFRLMMNRFPVAPREVATWWSSVNPPASFLRLRTKLSCAEVRPSELLHSTDSSPHLLPGRHSGVENNKCWVCTISGEPLAGSRSSRINHPHGNIRSSLSYDKKKYFLISSKSLEVFDISVKLWNSSGSSERSGAPRHSLVSEFWEGMFSYRWASSRKVRDQKISSELDVHWHRIQAVTFQRFILCKTLVNFQFLCTSTSSPAISFEADDTGLLPL